jgi:hypothetical protein
MSSLQQRIAALADETSGLVADLRELERLREQVRKAELARRSRQIPLHSSVSQFQLKKRYLEET